MFLAEDRILSLGIYCQVKSNYSLHYIPDAIAKTDAAADLVELLNQRRRWINSGYFALLYVLRNYKFHI
jgi:chitin synthase